MSSAGPSTAANAWGVMVANSAASPASTTISRSPSVSRTRPRGRRTSRGRGGRGARRAAWRFEAHLHGDGATGGRLSIQVVRSPEVLGDRTDDHVVVGARRRAGGRGRPGAPGKRYQDVEADRSLAGLDPADGGGAQVGARGELVERQAERRPQAAKPRADDLLDVIGLGHGAPRVLANPAREHALLRDTVSSTMNDPRTPHTPSSGTVTSRSSAARPPVSPPRSSSAGSAAR